MARTFLVTLHYDGGGFAGWQRQAEGRTVQAVLEETLERLAEPPIRVHAAGRTDAGVHAIGMGVSCSMPERWTTNTLRRALNATLPGDCWAESVQDMRPGFHARTAATGRRYRYVVGTDAGADSPFRRRYEWGVGRSLNLAALEHAADSLLGEHDFDAFSVKSSSRPHKRCRIRTSVWRNRGTQGLTYEVAADRFLHHMVRMLVGTMVDIGLGRRPAADLDRLLAREPGVTTSPPAPARGLYFVAADYPAECFA